jgi:Xaa-Pro aminopeptidase
VMMSEVDDAARSVIREAGYEKNFSHSLGHGVGLEVHEYPNFRDKELILQPGMVITIEPGIYVENFGGVRIEDTVAITEAGHQNLTNRSPDPIFL